MGAAAAAGSPPSALLVLFFLLLAGARQPATARPLTMATAADTEDASLIDAANSTSTNTGSSNSGPPESSWPFRTDKCLYDEAELCNTAVGGRVCAWCDSPRGCFPLDRLDDVSAQCERVRRRAPSLETECESVATRADCLAQELCRWCTSRVVDDACFGMLEARRLPPQVFNCSIIPEYYILPA